MQNALTWTADVRATYPTLRVAYLIAQAPGEYSDHARAAAEDKIVKSVEATYPSESELATPELVEPYRTFYSQMGLTPSKVTTPIKQANRVLQTKSYRSIHPIIDLCMEVEYATLVSFQVYDLDKLELPLTYQFADGTEPITTLSGEHKICKKGELILTDQSRTVHSSYYGNLRDASVTPGTKTTLIRVLAVPGLGDRFERAVKQIAKLTHAEAFLVD